MYSTAMMLVNPPFVNPINFRKHFPQHEPSSRPPLILKCCSTQDEDSDRSKLGFSVLKPRDKFNSIHSDRGTVYSTMALYVFSLHVPLSFGGLAAVANLVHQNPLPPQLVASSLLALQTSELILVFLLLVKPRYDVSDLFQTTYPRNWLLASAIGFLSILCSVFVTSVVGDRILGFEEVHDPSILQQLLSSGPVSVSACVLVYCIVTPLLEELVYRGYLLTSLSSSMKWYHAVLLSSLMFSAVHFSAENFVPLFAVGCVLGSSYCWTGNLTSPFLIHSLHWRPSIVIVNRVLVSDQLVGECILKVAGALLFADKRQLFDAFTDNVKQPWKKWEFQYLILISVSSFKCTYGTAALYTHQKYMGKKFACCFLASELEHKYTLCWSNEVCRETSLRSANTDDLRHSVRTSHDTGPDCAKFMKEITLKLTWLEKILFLKTLIPLIPTSE